jgi:hypothetical protein
MAAIYSNEGNPWNILGTKGDALSSVYYFITPFHSIVYIYKNLLLMLDQQLDSVDQFARALLGLYRLCSATFEQLLKI